MANPQSKSLYDKYGGAKTVEKVVDKFYSKVLGDSVLKPFFENVEMTRLKKHQVGFVSVLLGGPADLYVGKALKEAHAKLPITDQVFNQVGKHLQDTLVQSGVDYFDVEVIMAAVISSGHKSQG